VEGGLELILRYHPRVISVHRSEHLARVVQFGTEEAAIVSYCRDQLLEEVPPSPQRELLCKPRIIFREWAVVLALGHPTVHTVVVL
jgi:hypothetical protein